MSKKKKRDQDKFLTDYDEVLALSAYVTARLMLYRGNDKSNRKSVEFVRELILGGGTTAGDPKPAHAPQEVAEEIAAKLMFDPGQKVGRRSRAKRDTNGTVSDKPKSRRT